MSNSALLATIVLAFALPAACAGNDKVVAPAQSFQTWQSDAGETMLRVWGYPDGTDINAELVTRANEVCRGSAQILSSDEFVTVCADCRGAAPVLTGGVATIKCGSSDT